ncbi:hypothetical protein [Pseudomonas putida]|uniref:hypothetical protein n=1 Tax=Pseudomonas putida TaxID=303 RepID=UPI001260194A|nr:hypothetical protein [Pseudomonas putida]
MKFLKSFWSFAALIVLPVVVAAIASFVLYRDQFGGGFSDVSAKWSEFGGYIGGVLGPIVSFCTLLAVVRTVYLQRELIEVQKVEYKNLSAQQDAQIALAKEEMQTARTTSYRELQLRLVEMLIEQSRQEAFIIQSEISRHSKNPSIFQMGDYLANLSERNNQLAEEERQLRSVMVKLSVNEFGSLDEVKNFLEPYLNRFLNMRGHGKPL